MSKAHFLNQFFSIDGGHEAYIREHMDIPPDEDYEMDLKESDRKKLWGSAAAKCSKCKRDLFLKEESDTNIGKECHISSHRPNHPNENFSRYNPSLTDDERDKDYNNAILLCAPCHDIIDNPKSTQYTIEKLCQIKSNHETWVAEKLKEDTDESYELKKRIEEVRLIKRENEIEHTEDLKKVITHWIKDIPKASTDRLQNLSSGILTCYKDGINPLVDYLVLGTFNNHEMNLTIENEYIFKDLLFHLEKQTPEIVKLWTKYKEKCVEQYNIGYELVSEMAKEFTELIERETGIKQLKITKYGTELNSISEHYLNTMFHACIIYAEGKRDEFSKFYDDFGSGIRQIDNTIGYFISHLSTGYITIEKGLFEEKEFKTKMDGVMSQMFEKAKNEYNPNGEKVTNMIGEINILRNEIKMLLGDQLNYQEFKGKCKYL